jgi:hypothetical protein
MIKRKDMKIAKKPNSNDRIKSNNDASQILKKTLK